MGHMGPRKAQWRVIRQHILAGQWGNVDVIKDSSVDRCQVTHHAKNIVDTYAGGCLATYSFILCTWRSECGSAYSVTHSGEQ